MLLFIPLIKMDLLGSLHCKCACLASFVPAWVLAVFCVGAAAG